MVNLSVANKQQFNKLSVDIKVLEVHNISSGLGQMRSSEPSYFLAHVLRYEMFKNRMGLTHG